MTFPKDIFTKPLMVLLVSSFVYFLVKSDGDRAQTKEKVTLPNNSVAEQGESNDLQTPANECSESTE